MSEHYKKNFKQTYNKNCIEHLFQFSRFVEFSILLLREMEHRIFVGAVIVD